ncbi:Nn.00g001970.m01.CDS01 [Neocucurbitaria sp. VM-36]
MRKTILLCFIHGFKGGDETFRQFPSHLKALLQHALPKVTILTITYPQFETRGDLTECVARFREWLENKVIDLEVANSTPSPTIDPSVRTILVGHSMGGIVAAETLLSIIAEQPVPSLKNSQTGSTGSLTDHSTLMFPYIQGILAFDTPYLGIAPGVVAHGAEKHWQTASSAYSAYTNLAGAFGWGNKDSTAGSGAVDASKMLPAPSQSGRAVSDSNADAASAPLWQKYGRVAMFAGAAGAIAAGGAAAYMKKDQISQGVNWATSHLEFVGVLARPEEMRKRLASIAKMAHTQDFGFTNIYTTLGHAVNSENKESGWTGKVAGKDRTFCNLPKGELKNFFIPAVNDKSTAETWAHMSMFEPRNNPGYYTLSETAKEKIIEWAETTEWYEESEGPLQGEVEEEAEIVERQEVDEQMQREANAKEAEEAEEEFVDLKRPASDAPEWEDEARKRREL